MPTQEVQLAELRKDVGWIRDTLEKADLVNRVAALERGQARTQGVVAAIAASIPLISVLIAAAHAVGILH